ncbi:MAG: hypothetical protein ACRD2W_15205, partial [Acidimicrobiales bacterium]
MLRAGSDGTAVDVRPPVAPGGLANPTQPGPTFVAPTDLRGMLEFVEAGTRTAAAMAAVVVPDQVVLAGPSCWRARVSARPGSPGRRAGATWPCPGLHPRPAGPRTRRSPPRPRRRRGEHWNRPVCS